MNGKDIKEGMSITDVDFIVLKSEIRQTSKGKDYVNLDLRAVDGAIFEGCKRWDFSEVPGSKVISVNATVDLYNGKEQLKISFWKPSSLKPSDFQPKAPWEIDVETVSSLFLEALTHTNEKLRKYILNFIPWCQETEFPSLMRREEGTELDFETATGAIKVHHAYECGLIEHTLEVMNASRDLAITFNLSRNELELLIAGCAIHDIGKLFEYELVNGVYQHAECAKPYAEKKWGGGHLYIGSQMFAIYHYIHPGLTGQEYNVLQNILLSHHGEFGPVEPKYMVSMIAHHADHTSANLNRMRYALATTNKPEVDGDSIHKNYLRL